MTTAFQARRSLDMWLQRAGQDVTLQRVSPGTTPTVSMSVTVRAHIADFKPQEFDGTNGLQIGDSRLIMSPSEVSVAGWPGPDLSPIPRKGDRIIVAGRTRVVLYGWAAPYINGELVRIEAAIR